MKIARTLGITLALSLGACTAESPPSAVPDEPFAEGYEDNPDTGLPMNPSKLRLPRSVRIISDTQKNFGIDISGLTTEQASIVASAWQNYEAILSGGRPKCALAPFAPSDGGTEIYFCDGYNIARVQSLAGSIDVFGYEYGPTLDLLNGQRVERLRFYTDAELAKLVKADP